MPFEGSEVHRMAARVSARAFWIPWFLAWLLFLASPALEAKGHVEDVDFSCRGVYLGDEERKMLGIFGEPLFDRQVRVQGISVVYYSFPKGYDIGVSANTRKVMDIRVKDEKYQGRKGIRYGATPYKIKTTFGDKERRMIDGVIYYIYERPNHPHQRLLLSVDSENGSLTSFRITSLPLTEEEADAMAEDDTLSNELSVLLAGEKAIDTSAMPKQPPVKIRGLEK